MAAPELIEITSADDANEAAEPKPEAKKEAAQGPLLDLPEAQAAKKFDRLWKMHATMLRRYEAQWDVNKARRLGFSDVRLVKANDNQSIWKAHIPLAQAGTAPTPNRTDESVRGVIAALLVDEPKPDVLPSTDSDEDTEAAEFSTRILETETGESGLNLRAKMEGALDLAGTYASGFIRTWTDPYGSGRAPVEVLAHPQATTLQEAATGPEGAQPSSDYVLKYVLEDDTLSDSSAGAKVSWRPRVNKELLHGKQVRFVPCDASGVEDADLMLIITSMTFGTLKRRYPDVESMKAEDQWVIANWRPERFKDLLPDGMKVGETAKPDEGGDTNDGPPDESTVFVGIAYGRQTPEYPDGCYACFAGGKFRLHGEPWVLEYEDKKGNLHREPRDIPITQYRWMPDHQRRNPYGIAISEPVGVLAEIQNFINKGILESIFKALNPNVMFPMGTTVQAEAWGRRDGTPIMFNPQGKPEFEPSPVIPPYVTEMLQKLDTDIDRTAGREGTSSNLNTPNIRSNDQANTVLQASLVALASVRNATASAYQRECRITLQEFKASYKVPQMIRYLSEDGAYKYQDWSGADLSSAKDVRIRKGTFTQMTPMDRAQNNAGLLQLGALTMPELIRLNRSAVDSVTGAQDDRHYQRIKRQIAKWKEGPSEAVLAIPPQPPQMDPNTGQPIPAPSPVMQEAAAIFAPLPIDDEPAVAQIRHMELSNFMATTRFQRYPEEWKQGYIQAYSQARQAAGVVSIPQQQQAAQQAQQQQAEAAKQEQAMKMEATKATTQAEIQKAQMDMQSSTVKHQQNMEKLITSASLANSTGQIQPPIQ